MSIRFMMRISSDWCWWEKLELGKVQQETQFSSPGPHASLIIIIKVDRFTEEEKKTVDLLKQLFGEHLEKYVMILFTHKELLKEHNKTIDEFLQDCDPDLKNLVRKCGSRYLSLDNKSAGYQRVKELIRKIEVMVEENGKTHFTNKMFEQTEKYICRIQKQKFEEKMMLYKQMFKVRDVEDRALIHRRLLKEARIEALNSLILMPFTFYIMVSKFIFDKIKQQAREMCGIQ